MGESELEWVATASGGMNAYHSAFIVPRQDPHWAGVGLLWHENFMRTYGCERLLLHRMVSQSWRSLHSARLFLLLLHPSPGVPMGSSNQFASFHFLCT